MEPTTQTTTTDTATRTPRWVPWVVGGLATLVVVVALAMAALVATAGDDADDDDRLARDASAAITPTAAGEVALDAVRGDAQVVEVDLDDEGGVLVYEIELRDTSTSAEIDVVVDARTGEILTPTG